MHYLKFALFWQLLAVLGFITIVNSSFAMSEVIVVDSVQATAQVERDGKLTPLTVNYALQRGDYITTDAEGRVTVRLPDGSLARIGHKSRVKIDNLIIPARASEPMSANFSVLQGVFRYTSGESNAKRAVEIKVGNAITAGIRGTDLMVNAAKDKDWVCLISGKIQVNAGEISEVLDEPREFFVVPKGQKPEPVSFFEEEKFKQWIKEVE